MGERRNMEWSEWAQCYSSKDGFVMKREYGTLRNGNDIGGRWVLRDSQGEMLAVDQYRHDLADRFNLNLSSGGRWRA